MRNAIAEYLEYTDEEKKKLWKDATFVFDTNVLLNLYRYSKETRDALLNSMEQLKDRIWMPYHVAYEFMDDRAEIIYQVSARFDNLKKAANEFVDKCADQLKMKRTLKDFEELKRYLSDWIDDKKNKNYVSEKYSNDSVLNKLLEIFDGKAGVKYSDQKLKEIKDRGYERYQKKVPPGYMDFDKKKKKEDNSIDDNNMYGDFIIWNQIIDYANQNKKDIIFVTDDQKDDWWNNANGETLGPRIEIRKEFMESTGQKFHMYTMESFIKFSAENGGVKYDQSVIDEIETIDRHNYNFEIGAILSSHDNDEREFVSKRFQIAMRIEQLKEKNEKRKKALKEIEDNLEKGRYSANRIRQYEILQDKIEETNQTILMLESKYRGLGLLL